MSAAPTTYAIRVDGHLDDHWSVRFGDLTRDDDGTTTITVSVADQAQLHGILAGLHDIGAVLTELRATGAQAAPRTALDPRFATPVRPALAIRPDLRSESDGRCLWSGQSE